MNRVLVCFLLVFAAAWAQDAAAASLVTAADLLAARGLQPFRQSPAGPSALRTAPDLLRELGIADKPAGLPGAGGVEEDGGWDDGEDMGC